MMRSALLDLPPSCDAAVGVDSIVGSPRRHSLGFQQATRCGHWAVALVTNKRRARPTPAQGIGDSEHDTSSSRRAHPAGLNHLTAFPGLPDSDD